MGHHRQDRPAIEGIFRGAASTATDDLWAAAIEIRLFGTDAALRLGWAAAIAAGLSLLGWAILVVPLALFLE